MGQKTIAITDVLGSTMAGEATISFPTKAGSERVIPATKSFAAQLLNLYLPALLRPSGSVPWLREQGPGELQGA